MKHWFKDQHFRSLLRNSSYLAVSRIVAAVASVATLALCAHGLGLLMFGVLRALDRFDQISWQSTATPISRMILVAIAYAADAPFGAYVAAWYVTALGGDLYEWFLAWRELRRRGLIEGMRPTLRPKRLPG